MDHRRAWKLLSPYRDGELDDADQKAVAAHVAQCEECRSELAWDAMASAVFRRPAGLPSEGFATRIMARLAESSRAPLDPFWLSLRRWMVPAIGVAAAALLLALLIPENGATDDTQALLLADAGGESGGVEALLVSSPETDLTDEPALED